MERMDRRTFLKGALATGAATVTGAALAGCAPSATAEKAMEEEKPAPTSPNETTYGKMSGLTDGKYVTKVMGHEDYLYMETTIAGGAIANLKVLRNDETRGVGTQACDKFPARLVEAQNLDIDVMSGATISCNAIIKAVEQGITNAGGNPADFHKGAVKPSGGTAHTESVDVVIMGAGTAGLVAATRLLEKGINTLVIEKQSITGGSMCMTYSGVAAAESSLQKNFGLGHYEQDTQYNLEVMLAFLKKFFPINDPRFGGSLPYERAMYTVSGDLVDWMNSIGIGFQTMGVSPAYGITPFLAPGCYNGGCGQAMQFLTNRIGMLGGTIVLDTPVKELVQDASGRVTGLKAEGKDGSTWDITAKAVCLASGGFGANEEMKKQYYPDYTAYAWNCAPGSTGEGIVMGQKAGAAIECMDRNLGAFLSTTPQAGSFFEIAFIQTTAPGIMVNADGDQFANIISGNHAALSKALRDPANGGKFFYLTDESGANCLMKAPGYDFETYRALFSRGDIAHYDSVEDAAAELGLTDLADTIETHNAHALAGEPDDFKRKNLPYLDTHDGIWVVSCIPTPYLTTGGLAIDTSCHVLKEDQSIIPGLYAAGDVCGSIEEKDGKEYGMGFDAAMNFGYIMAETIAAEI